jgi:ribosomal protein S18 acetylase RimI-like enzyme
MIPIQPELSTRPLRQVDHVAAADLISVLLRRAPYSLPLDTTRFEHEVTAAEPPTVFPVRWQRHLQIGAWRAGELVGFLDLAAGLDSDSSDLPDYQPIGIVRFLALPERPELMNDVSHLLFERALQFWKAAGVGYVKAFHISTGYPSFQAGAGVLPGDWDDHVRELTTAGFQFQRRYYCLRRKLDKPLEESVPTADISIAFRGSLTDRTYDIYYRRTDWVGRARCRTIIPDDAESQTPFAHLAHIEIDRRWRRQNLGRWLLRRVINDATTQGMPEIAVHVSHEYGAALNLFAEHGFEELNYRGYTLDQTLRE